MGLSAKERRAVRDMGMLAALARVGAYTCPFIEDDQRFAAWIEGYEAGEKTVTRSESGPVEAPVSDFWGSVKPISRDLPDD